MSLLDFDDDSTLSWFFWFLPIGSHDDKSTKNWKILNSIFYIIFIILAIVLHQSPWMWLFIALIVMEFIFDFVLDSESAIVKAYKMLEFILLCTVLIGLMIWIVYKTLQITPYTG